MILLSNVMLSLSKTWQSGECFDKLNMTTTIISEL